MMTEDVRVRFAPSPTGLLHVGNLRTALFAWLHARQKGGAFLLRIEDTDRERSEARFEDLIYEDLRWFGMDWDEGPDVGGPHAPYRQSERGSLYLDQAARLVDSARAYRCFCSESELAAAAQKARTERARFVCPGNCRHLDPGQTARRLEAGDRFVVRLAVRDGVIDFDDVVHGRMTFNSEVIADPILLRSDSTPTYNFAVVVDDALMNITDVIRGDDHLSNTPKQVLIYEALGRAVPRFAHLSTVLGPDHTKLSKRHGATSIADFRDAGYLPEALMNYLALLGWSPGAEGSEVVPPDRLVQEFCLDRVNRNPAVFDYGKLRFLNRAYLRQSAQTPVMVTRALSRAGLVPDPDNVEPLDPESKNGQWVRMVIDALIGGVDVADDVAGALAETLRFPIEESDDCRETAEEPGAIDLIRAFHAEIDRRGELTPEEFREIVASLKATTGRKGKALFHPMRVALTARGSGPELDRLIVLVEAGARLGVPGVRPCRERVAAFLARFGPA
jgi:glutamyl-tRNA synthetase/nondiscriminating glutamyl-tRNA synthetase